MTRETAQNVIERLLAGSEALSEALLWVQAEAAEPLRSDYRKRTADVMGAIYFDLLKPVVALHPDLEPGADPPRDDRSE